jgi:hypothetical protein
MRRIHVGAMPTMKIVISSAAVFEPSAPSNRAVSRAATVTTMTPTGPYRCGA